MHQDESTDSVHCFLLEGFLSLTKCSLQSKLRHKFDHQQKANCKLMKEKLKFIEKYIRDGFSFECSYFPIEFVHDDYLLLLAISTGYFKNESLLGISNLYENRKSMFELAMDDKSMAYFPGFVTFANQEMLKDRKIAKFRVSHFGYDLEILPEEFKCDKEIVLEAVGKYGLAIRFACEELKNDIDVIRRAVTNYPIEISEKVFRENPDLACYYVVRHQNAPDFVWHWREVMLNAVKTKPILFLRDSFPQEFRMDKEFILIVSEKNITLLDSIDGLDVPCLDEKEFVLEQVRKNGLALKYASKRLQGDEDVIFACLENDPSMIGSTLKKGDAEFCLRALKLGYQIQSYISSSILDLPEFEQFRPTAPFFDNDNQGGWGFGCIEDDENTEETIISREYVLELAKKSSSALFKSPKEFRNDKEIILEALSHGSNEPLKYISDKMKLDRDILLKSVKNDFNILSKVKSTLRSDKEFIIECAKRDFRSLEFSSIELQSDKEFILNCFLHEPSHPDSRVLTELVATDSEFKRKLIDIILEKKIFISVLPDYLKENEEVILNCIRESKDNYFDYFYLGKNITQKREFMCKMLQASPNAVLYYFASDIEIKQDEEYKLVALRHHGYFDPNEIKNQQDLEYYYKERMDFYFGGSFKY